MYAEEYFEDAAKFRQKETGAKITPLVDNFVDVDSLCL